MTSPNAINRIAINVTVFIQQETTPEEFNRQCEKYAEYQINDRGHLGFTALAASVSANNQKLLEHILRIGGQPSINIPNLFGYTPLHHAVNIGSYCIAKKLIEHNADVNARTKGSCTRRYTPLQMAATSVYDLALTKLLLVHGAMAGNPSTEYGVTLLHRAKNEVEAMKSSLYSKIEQVLQNLPIVLIQMIAHYAIDERDFRNDWTCRLL